MYHIAKVGANSHSVGFVYYFCHFEIGATDEKNMLRCFENSEK